MSTYGKALALATGYHAGQKRKNGEDYINHCKRVAEAVSSRGEPYSVVAVLHDTLEDTDLTREKIRDIFGAEVAFYVEVLTHREEQTYLEYILECKKNIVTTEIKLADLGDNLNGATGTLRDKYLMAKYILEN